MEKARNVLKVRKHFTVYKLVSLLSCVFCRSDGLKVFISY